jgi:hypothetical protein
VSLGFKREVEEEHAPVVGQAEDTARAPFRSSPRRVFVAEGPAQTRNSQDEAAPAGAAFNPPDPRQNSHACGSTVRGYPCASGIPSNMPWRTFRPDDLREKNSEGKLISSKRY